MSKKIVAVNASPRKGWNTDALKQVAGGACYGVDVCPKNLVPTKR